MMAAPARANMTPDRTGLAPELQVLMATVRDDGDDLAHRLEGGLSWKLLVFLSEEEKATPVLHRRLAALRRQGVRVEGERDVLAALERLAWVHQFRLLELERRLVVLLREYRREGIAAVLLKGAALRWCVYDSLLDRPMGDVDLLVEPGQAGAAREIARDLGWDRPEGVPSEGAYAGHHHLAPLGDDAGMGLELEIHTELFHRGSPFPFSGASILAGAREAEADPHPLVPSPEHLLLHTALHFTWSHRFRYGAWKTFRDVDALVSRGGIDWDRFLGEARAARAGSGAFWTLYLAREWAGVPIGNEVLNALAPPGPAALRRALARHFALQMLPPPGAEPPGRLNRWLWVLAMRPGREGHGRARPWVGRTNWNEAGDGPVPGTDPQGPSLVAKGAGAFRHLQRMLAGERLHPARPVASAVGGHPDPTY